MFLVSDTNMGLCLLMNRKKCENVGKTTGLKMFLDENFGGWGKKLLFVTRHLRRLMQKVEQKISSDS